MPDNLSSVLLEIAARAVKTRRDLHRFPELDMIEFRTASIVAERPYADIGITAIGTNTAGTCSSAARTTSAISPTTR